MIETTQLLLFIGASFLLCLAPGPDNIYVLTQGMTKSKKAAIVTTLGLCSGLIIHTSAAALGISVVFQTSEIAFNIVKYVGAMYLVYIAYQAFKYRNEPLDLSVQNTSSELKKLFVKGFIMNILNPKDSIFLLSFFTSICKYSSWKCTNADDIIRLNIYDNDSSYFFKYWSCGEYTKFKTFRKA